MNLLIRVCNPPPLARVFEISLRAILFSQDQLCGKAVQQCPNAVRPQKMIPDVKIPQDWQRLLSPLVTLIFPQS